MTVDRAIFFDLDGTLTDPKSGIVRSIQFALDTLGVDRPSDDQLIRYIGPPLLESFKEIVGPARAGEALDYYRERFSACGWKENEPYDGIHEALEQLVGTGQSLYVATSKPRVFADRIIEHFGLARYISRIFGSELDGTRSDKTSLLRYALEAVAPKSQPTMVGDRRHDMIGATANHMRSVGVAFGYGSREELVMAGADIIVERPSQLPTACE